MSDLVGDALRAVPSGALASYPLAFGAGLVTSAGPCVAPRYIVLAALVQTARNPWRITLAYVVGLVAAMVALGLAVDGLAALRGASTAIDLALALTLAIAGIATLLRGGRAPARAHAPSRTPAGMGGIALLGASGALVVSPCCTPILAAIAGLTIGAGQFSTGAAVLAAYALGHAAPLLLAALAGAPLAAAFAKLAGTHAPATVSGTLMVALGAYYGVLA
jgi:cytochrome c biogenesis protein CcdA